MQAWPAMTSSPPATRATLSVICPTRHPGPLVPSVMTAFRDVANEIVTPPIHASAPKTSVGTGRFRMYSSGLNS